MADRDDYIYAVTRVHANEQNLLNAQDIQKLIEAESESEALGVLRDKGWGGDDKTAGADAVIAHEQSRTWALISELVKDMAPFNVFCIANDYHNLKAAIKLAYAAHTQPNVQEYFVEYGTVPVDVITKAANSHDFTALDPAMAEAGMQAYKTLAQTSSGQACDMVIDKAALVAIGAAGEKSESELLKNYARLVVDAANIKAAVRCCAMGKSDDFIGRAIAPAGTLDTRELIKAAANGIDALYAYLGTTKYAAAVGELEKSMAEFERWCDDELIRLIKPQRYNYFSIEPLAAFILGRENEIKTARLILAAKLNGMSKEALKARVRETYV